MSLTELHKYGSIVVFSVDLSLSICGSDPVGYIEFLNNSLVYFVGGSSPLAATVDYNSRIPQIGCFYGQEAKQQMEEVTTGTEHWLALFVSMLIMLVLLIH